MVEAASAERPNSLRGSVSAAEWETRVDLAAACRLTRHFGWNNTIRNHITARVPDEPNKFLITPMGLLWEEISASDLIKVDYDGKVYSKTDLFPGPAGVNFHGAVLKEKPHLNCSFHVHPMDAVVVSALKDGLLYTCQESLYLYGQVGYHDFEGIASDAEEGVRINRDLGDKACLIMWNHGLLSVGESIAEAFVRMERLIEACQIQVKLFSTGREIREIPKEICERTYQQFQHPQSKRVFGIPDWKAYFRLAERLDPSFKL